MKRNHVLMPSDFLLYLACIQTDFDMGIAQRIVDYFSDGGDYDLGSVNRFAMLDCKPALYLKLLEDLPTQKLRQTEWTGGDRVLAIYGSKFDVSSFTSMQGLTEDRVVYVDGSIFDRHRPMTADTPDYRFMQTVSTIGTHWLKEAFPQMRKH